MQNRYPQMLHLFSYQENQNAATCSDFPVNKVKCKPLWSNKKILFCNEGIIIFDERNSTAQITTGIAVILKNLHIPVPQQNFKLRNKKSGALSEIKRTG